jgi:molecular chaperone DnaK (HSP70)
MHLKHPLAVKLLTEFKGKYARMVAIDFGTTFSGIAWAEIDAQKIERIHTYDAWVGSPPGPKQPTVLVYKTDGTVVIGWEAMQLYLTNNKEQKNQNLLKINHLFKEFKLNLQNKDNQFESKIHGVETVQLIADYMKKMVNNVLNNSPELAKIPHDKILWCLTVPAIWNETAIGVMKEAATRAGFITNANAENFLIVAEPEAAALYAMHDYGSDFKNNDTYMIVDAGGGTVDIAYYHFRKKENGDSNLKQLHIVPTNDPKYKCGSTFLDRAFEKYLDGKLGVDFIKNMKETDPESYMLLIKQWEVYKCGYDTEMRLMGEVTDYMERCVEFSSSSNITQNNKDNAHAFRKTHKGKIPFTKNELEEFIYNEVLNNVIACIEENLRTMPCDYLILVGGFSKSVFLQERVKKYLDTYSAKPKVIQQISPKEPQEAIVVGAAIYAINPKQIHTRISARNYGIQTTCKWGDYTGLADKDELIRNGAKPDNNQPQEYIGNSYSIIIHKEQSVKAEQVFADNVYHTRFPDQKVIRIEMYVSDEKYNNYYAFIDEKCLKMGEFTIPLVPTPDKQSIEVIFTLSGQKLQVKAKSINTGNEISGKEIPFNSDFK